MRHSRTKRLYKYLFLDYFAAFCFARFPLCLCYMSSYVRDGHPLDSGVEHPYC
jgi:hypothetical protein